MIGISMLGARIELALPYGKGILRPYRAEGNDTRSYYIRGRKRTLADRRSLEYTGIPLPNSLPVISSALRVSHLTSKGEPE